MDDKQAKDRAHELAMRIYVELVARHTEIGKESVKLAASAGNIATLSLRLAQAFVEAEAEAIAAAEPVKGYVLGNEDIAKWTK